MPYIEFSTNKPLGPEQADVLKAKLAALLADAFPGKTETWLMVKIAGDGAMYFAGSPEDCAMVDVSILGHHPKAAYQKMTAAVCEMVKKECGIPASRVYVKYGEYEEWGWNGSNF